MKLHPQVRIGRIIDNDLLQPFDSYKRKCKAPWVDGVGGESLSNILDNSKDKTSQDKLNLN